MSKHDWETQTQEVLPAVFRVPLPLPGDHLKAVNVYVIVDGDRLALIDAGWALEDSERQLDRSLATLGFQLADIREFLVTHVHRDHYTQAVALRRRFGSHVSLGEGEQVTLDAIHSIDVDPQIDRMEIAGAAELARQLRLEDDFAAQQDLANFEYPNRWLHDRNELTLKTRTLSVIATPGHTRGHVVFHDPNAGALFAGDHVLPHITPSVGSS